MNIKSILVAGLLSLSFAANAAPVTVLGYNIDDAETNVFSGEYVIVDQYGHESGALDYNTVNGTLIHQCCGAGSNYADANVEGFYNEDTGVHTQTPSYVTFEVFQELPGQTEQYLGTLMQGSLTYAGFGNDYNLVLDGGALFDQGYFTNGIFNYDNTMVGGHFTNMNFTLTMAPVSAVPVPAAVWLFGSGLLGMVAIGRRRKV